MATYSQPLNNQAPSNVDSDWGWADSDLLFDLGDLDAQPQPWPSELQSQPQPSAVPDILHLSHSVPTVVLTSVPSLNHTRSEGVDNQLNARTYNLLGVGSHVLNNDASAWANTWAGPSVHSESQAVPIAASNHYQGFLHNSLDEWVAPPDWNPLLSSQLSTEWTSSSAGSSWQTESPVAPGIYPQNSWPDSDAGLPRSADLPVVQYQMPINGQSLTASRNDRRHRGRKGPLTSEQRKEAALMRLLGACASCKRRKAKCDPGTPCKACVEHFRTNLIHHPCRERLLHNLTASLLSPGTFPNSRSLDDFLGVGRYGISPQQQTLPINLGFGPSMQMQVQLVMPLDRNQLLHQHVVYQWPPQADGTASKESHHHFVFPAILSNTDDLHHRLDEHLSSLVKNHFESFPLYPSPLCILRNVYDLYKQLDQPQSTILHQALKLLFLVHVGGDIAIDHSSPITRHVLSTILPTSTTSTTPCFIRGQFGAIMPTLASTLLHSILTRLERLALSRQCAQFPIIFSTLAVLLMAVESIQYHAAKVAYHAHYSNAAGAADQRDELAERQAANERAAEALLSFYRACYTGCHAQLQTDEGQCDDGFAGPPPSFVSVGQQQDPTSFVANLRTAILGAKTYLEGKSRVTVMSGSEDLGCFFDRLLARLLLLRN